jgi:hypothetical protein
MKQADHRDMFKKASKGVYTSTVVVSPDPLSPTIRNSSPMTLNQQFKEISKWNTLLISFTAQA